MRIATFPNSWILARLYQDRNPDLADLSFIRMSELYADRGDYSR